MSIETAAEKYADHNIGGEIAHTWFVLGATWAAARITPTREQIAQALADTYEPEYNIVDESDYHGADAIIELMSKLAKGDTK